MGHGLGGVFGRCQILIQNLQATLKRKLTYPINEIEFSHFSQDHCDLQEAQLSLLTLGVLFGAWRKLGSSGSLLSIDQLTQAQHRASQATTPSGLCSVKGQGA